MSSFLVINIAKHVIVRLGLRFEILCTLDIYDIVNLFLNFLTAILFISSGNAFICFNKLLFIGVSLSQTVDFFLHLIDLIDPFIDTLFRLRRL